MIKEELEKKANKKVSTSYAVWIGVVVVAISVGLGFAIDDIPIGIGIGVATGYVFYLEEKDRISNE